jgi:hypothetical protein
MKHKVHINRRRWLLKLLYFENAGIQTGINRLLPVKILVSKLIFRHCKFLTEKLYFELNY